MQGWERDAQVVMEHAFTLGFDRMGLVGASAGGATALQATQPRRAASMLWRRWHHLACLRRPRPEAACRTSASQVRKGSMSDASSAPVVPPDDFYADLVAHDLIPSSAASVRFRCCSYGDADHYVSVGTAQRLFEAAREPKELVIIPGAGASCARAILRSPP